MTYAECTVGDHVYYARYLDWLEAARGEFLRSLGVPLTVLVAEDVALPVVECQLSYRSPARYDDVVTVETWVAALERVRLGFAHRVLKAGGVEVVRATTVHACTTLAGRPKRLPEALRERLAHHLPAGGSAGPVGGG